ncbi:MAG: tryptophan-rich sensory protein [Flavobacteriia bacterium]|nr:tryptophan-rich sensory protein [Flavobacteriia bacterium]OIP46209.1 MAG: TspO protein [Flavobacteriaceae bacterium CG2_30_31_66]PIV96844.1 MAG: TspO protein [Flavobacteriaceae bacterium CG17_big_fil_post_rev_8_21_14_2_50_31_13]PIX14683.1 MAG: TspO protein [Flavobacteriaceae bacterium CG_4_8_14_3_um_filter_31_8]PIY15694.1 MAG: TspO protein [Flavobacteriaceae bacterium CG_4_10_14_3_um_filter_31_253]PIZ09535.1 MAG: TspO protein [Flavobacteriaceae bacterium CG_4_10_14_0_8_um_filter_31_99]PJC1
MKKIWLLLIFLAINFGGLAIGSFLMNEGPTSEWYSTLNKAPWTPYGWVFGVAWTAIMICFSIYLAKLFTSEINKTLIFSFFLIEFFLNVSWNYLFFNQHLVLTSLIGIILLTLVLFYFYFNLSKNVGKYKYLLLPYMFWLCIATSLNFYVLVNN